MLVCLAPCTFILHCSANATRQFVSRAAGALFFLVGEEKQKTRDVVRVSYWSLCVRTFGVDAAHVGICTHLPPIGRGETKPPLFFLPKSFRAAFVRREGAGCSDGEGSPVGCGPALNCHIHCSAPIKRDK